MAINLAEKYASQIQQKFTAASYVDGHLSNKLDFVGARTVHVYTINSVALNDYSRAASANRYGTPAEIGDTKQELYMRQDKSFTGIIDKGNSIDQTINKVGQFIAVETDEVIVPTMDAYKLKRLADFAGTRACYTADVKASNIVARMAAGRKVLKDNRVPTAGCTIFVTTNVFNALVECDQFKNLINMGEKALGKGVIGEMYGMKVVECPSDIMPEGCNFIMVHKDAACTPVKLNETKVHLDPPGVSGSLVEGRFYYDCFVFDAKKYGIYADYTGASTTPPAVTDSQEKPTE